MGVIAEKMSDDKGLVWPANIAPYTVYLVSIGEKGAKAADELYEALQEAGIEVLYDDRDERPGAKFADAELLGIPYRVTVSDRLVEEGKIELVTRVDGQMQTLTNDELFAKMKAS
jgi:prolyl-tRNA synthetase